MGKGKREKGKGKRGKGEKGKGKWGQRDNPISIRAKKMYPNINISIRGMIGLKLAQT